MRRQKNALSVLLISALILFIGCSNKPKSKEEECADETKTAKAASGDKKASATSKKDRDWCRACVVGPHGFMSCQRVTQQGSESRGELRQKARDKACEDSGFRKDACPDNKVIALSCKGDTPPKDKTAAGKAMLKALKTSGPLILKKPDPNQPTPTIAPREGKPPKESAPSEEAPPKPKGKTKTPVPVV